MKPIHGKPVQIAYFVSNIREAAARMAAIAGAGPFYVVDNIELEWGEHRGSPCSFVHSSAYGQWGDLMLELVQQDKEGPSPFRDMYARGQEGLHHVACFVDSIDDALAEYDALGYPTAARAKAMVGTEFAFVDATASLGHMLEIYVPDETLSGFYEFVQQASIDWDGSELLRTL